ncbi:MAG: AAA family ATPase [Gammaproteobacteria bacterium]|jgi:circadian clock protein KaiC|nr:AAA family ATPase [Gammaproteobacteria bacterium]
MTEPDQAITKRPTGITGLDWMTHGGLPAAGGTLVLGRPASGKTVLTLQIIAQALARDEAAVFVSFEESRAQVLRDAASFSWGQRLAEHPGFELIDARPSQGAQVSGEFDLGGLLAGIEHCVQRTRAEWLILDGIDQLLYRHRDPFVAIEQVHRVSDWSEERGLTLLLTGKLDQNALAPKHLEGVEFLLPSVMLLSTTLIESRLARRFRIAKYRGSAHTADEVPMLIDTDGVHFPYTEEDSSTIRVERASQERLSTGIDRLDEVLDGGLYRASTTLISGQPGTAKTTLCGSFAAAATARGERVLYLSFDEIQAPVIRNLASVGIELGAPIEAGLLRFVTREAWSSLLETHYHALVRGIEELEPACRIIDPISALFKAAGPDDAKIAIERLLSKTRASGITTVLTSLNSDDDPGSEETLSHASTLADTWLTLGFNVVGGERNRSLSVVKSRGTAHSNQVRELILADGGLDLADVYEYGTEVLMGTARLQKENEEALNQRLRALEDTQRRQDLERRIETAEAEAARLRIELQAQQEEQRARETLSEQQQRDVVRRRQAAAPMSEETPAQGVRERSEGNHR